MYYNKSMISGRLTANPELKTTQSGISVATVTVAVNRPKQKDKEQETDFINVVLWRQKADFVSQYFKKGDWIFVEGSITVRSYDKDGSKRYVTELVATDAKFVGSKKDDGSGSGGSAPNVGYTEPSAGGFQDIGDDDELPF